MDREPEAFPSLRTFQQTSNTIKNAIAHKSTCINDRRTGMEELELRREVAKFGNSDMLLRDKLEILGGLWSTRIIASIVRKVSEMAAIQGLGTKEPVEVDLLLRGIYQRMGGKPKSGIASVTEARKQINVSVKALGDHLKGPLFGHTKSMGN